MRVLYLTNYHNPYRDEFFEQLGRRCDLTVLFEQRVDAARDASWFEEVEARSYQEVYLPEGECGPVSPTMLKTVEGDWSLVVVGCYNTTWQMATIVRMHRRRAPYVVNSDGMVFETGSTLKRAARGHVLRGDGAYLYAGEACVPSLRRIVGRGALVAPYPFSSLTEERARELARADAVRDPRLVLVVGQYEDYKGLDVMLDAIPTLSDGLRFRFVGMGKKADEFRALVEARGLSDDVEVVPFLKPDDLAKEYLGAGLLVLPNRQECWGLVANEAAACGCPVVSAWGSGAAVEFISRDYLQFLAEPGSAASLALTAGEFTSRSEGEKREYSAFLRRKAAEYTIEATVDAHASVRRGGSR
ncbi:MAG: glycosyltransferase [Coriobacteriaceae bacterium]|nr:glycosyltransferase [Coriobacteriaceae bacterium]